MKIRIKMIISMVLFGVALIIIFISVITTNQQVARLNKQKELARNIELKAGDLNYLSNDYLLYRESQQIGRWETKFASISNDLAALHVGRPDQRMLVNNLKLSQQRLKEIFGDTRTRMKTASHTQPVKTDLAFVQVSWSRMGIQTQGIIFDASRLAQRINDQAEQMKQINTLLIIALMGTFIAYLLTDYLVIYRRTLQSLLHLQAGTRMIGSGALDFTITVRNDDEIGALARAFNEMTMNLKTVTASKEDLEQEILERKRIEETLRESEERYRAFFENSLDAVLITSPDGAVYAANPAACTLFGMNEAEFIQVGCGGLSDGADPRFQLALEEQSRTGRFKGELNFKRKDGAIFPGEITNSFYNDRNGQVRSVLMIRDVSERKRDEEQKIAGILENITDCFYILSRDWRFIYVNKGAEEFCGRKREYLLGKIIWDEYPDTAKDSANIYLRKAMAEQKPYAFAAYYEASGRWFDYHIYPGPEGLSVYFQDITEKKGAEKITQQLAAIVENSEDAIISMTPRGLITSWNKGAVKLYGYTAAEMIGQSSLLIVPPEFQEQMRGAFENLNQDQFSEDHHTVRHRKDGAPVYVSIKTSFIKDAAGKVVEVSSIHRDITERTKFQEALNKERELLMITLNSINEGVVAADQEERIFLINEAAVSLTGYTRMEAIDEPINKILYLLDDQNSEPLQVLSAPSLNSHPVLVTRDLKEVLISIHSAPIKADDGRVIGSVTVFQDITEKQKAQQERFKAEKLESLGILAGGIAHDFNNILGAISANLQLAQLKHRKNEPIEKYLDQSLASTHRAGDLTKQLLTFSTGGAPIKKAASLADMIQDTAQFVLRGSPVRAEFSLPENLWPVEVDIGQISQVIQNLTINAKQAMPKGGIIEVSAENIVIESKHRYRPGRYIKITIKDQGVGIAKEHLPKIFDPFFTTKTEGSGLGLATSYSIIRQHDGHIEVESEIGSGTTFHIFLPALWQEMVLPEAQKEIAVINEGLKILLMDDEEAILNSVGEMLTARGHQAVCALDGAAAIKLYRQGLDNGEPFDVVIMDLTVPGGMGGQAAIAHLRDIDPRIKAIVSSGYANDPIMADYERFGFSGVITKPYRFDELNEVLYKVIERRQLPLNLEF